jgi:hypothetical protein
MTPKPSVIAGPNVFDCDCEMAYLKAWQLLSIKAKEGKGNASLLIDSLPHFENMHGVYCTTYFRQAVTIGA